VTQAGEPVVTMCVPVECSNGDNFALRLTRQQAERLWRELGWELGTIGKPIRLEPEEEGDA
jgi:sugar phosphate isomerase/epimerase